MTAEEKINDIRTNWAEADRKRDENLTVPEDIKAYYDISYGPHGSDNLLDIYMRNDAAGLQPVIVNIHGGAWVYGSKDIYRYYCMSLAQRGFTVVNINYRLAPENVFPSALEDVNAALGFIAENGLKYSADRDRVILTGDSAGAQIASHYAAVFSNPDFAALYDFILPAVRIKALGLNCGIYDAASMSGADLDDLFMSYAGTLNCEITPEKAEQLDVLKYIDSRFPPSFVMTAEHDFLKDKAGPMYELLKKNSVPAVLKVYGSADQPEISHVFHVNMNLPEAKICNDDECKFFRNYV